jgi:hypothetical protein
MCASTPIMVPASTQHLTVSPPMNSSAQAAQKLNSMFEVRKEHLAVVSRSWWRGAGPEAAEVPNWTEGSAGDRFFENSRMKKYAV